MKSTVLLQVRDHESYVRTQLRSLFAQWRDDVDLLVIDDASTDASLSAVLEELGRRPDVRATIRRNASALGLGGYHDVLRHSGSDIFIQADSDDITLPGRLDQIIQCFEADSNCRLVTSNAIIMSDQGILTGIYNSRDPDFVFEDPGIGATEIYIPQWLGTTSACHRSVLTEFPIIDPELCPQAFDIVAPLRALLLGTHHYLATPLVAWRQHGRNTHRTNGAFRTDAAGREFHGAIEIMAIAQKLRDVEAFQEAHPEATNTHNVRDLCQKAFFDRFAEWCRDRSRLMTGFEAPMGRETQVVSLALPAIVTLERGIQRSFGNSDPLGEAAASWQGIHWSEETGNWTERNATLLFRVDTLTCNAILLDLQGLAGVEGQTVRAHANFGPCADQALNGAEPVRLRLSMGAPLIEGYVVIVLHAPCARTRPELEPTDPRQLGVWLKSITVV